MPDRLADNNDIRPKFWKLMLINLGKFVAILPLLIAVIFSLILLPLFQIIE